MSSLLLKRPNRLIYPGGQPGFNPAHPAARGFAKNRGISAVAMSSNSMLDLFAGIKFNTAGSGFTASTLSNIGPAISFTAGSAQALSAPNQSTSAAPGVTMAAICQWNIVTTGDHTLIETSGNTVFGVNTNQGGINFYNNGYVGSGITPSVGVPYFVAGSIAGGSTVNFLLLNLVTGQIKTAVSSTPAAVFITGSFYIGSNSVAQGCGAAIAAIMYAPAYLPMPQLKAWAQDPWSFWYPQQIDLLDLVYPPLSGGTTVNVWTGSTWATKPVKVWNGSVWVQKPVKRWNGSSWV